ncbi:amino acid permease [Grosmannia clavigera kw1407]|uniref:Amino acid permease n=1 Tax=Grosmannia clavigera (strain kw1407 / UAMH 11150) TaxID=655863 RepID=F0XCE7_GROCL|nr:amino acid permease [Grosmannia clavigera kw1407]EFX03461.1 amino acid permease [Grosmannia clavigera kw1407]
MSETDYSNKEYRVEISSEAHVFDAEKPLQRGSTNADERDMEMLGRTQVLNRNFRFLSTLGFACTLMSTWEIGLMTTVYGLANGGTAGLIWGYLIVWMGYMLVFASIAEMASISPTAGGQYHWVSEFAPPRAQKFFSYIIGWVAVLGWQTGLASLAFLAGTMIQGLLVLTQPDYVFENWHGTLLVIAITAFCIIFNTFLAGRLPMVEGMVLVVHVLGFFAVLIPLWVLAPRSTAGDVFGTFANLGGWSSTGLAFFVGLLSPVYTLIGADSAVHMSEEVRDASRVLPRAIMWAAVVNGTMGWVMLITFCFTLGNLLDVLDSPTGYPFIQVFYNVTHSMAGTCIMTAILIVNITSACISTVATVSRQTWSFARDNGLPFSAFIAHVKPGWNIPLNAVLVTFVITTLLSLINIGSAVAFNAIGSLAVTALLGTYLISFTFLIMHRLTGSELPGHRWSLGRWGLPINLGSVLFLIVVWVFAFFPQYAEVTSETMNWNVVIFVGVMVFAVTYYYMYGRKSYMPPVSLMRRNE